MLVLLERIWISLGTSLTALGASVQALGLVLGAIGGLLKTSSAYENLTFKNERFVLAGTPCGKPVRARTGIELLRERMISRGIEKKAATDPEQVKQETDETIKRRVTIMFLSERAGAR